MYKLAAKDLRKTPPTPETFKTIKRNPVYLVLDGVMDTYNIGSLFRLADAIAVQELYICGDTEYPPSSRIHKAAVGTEVWVPWKKFDTTLEAIKELKEKGVQIIVVEQNEKSISYKDLNTLVKFPCAIIVGHETTGVSKDVIKAADLVIEMPMFGVNKSFNVWGSAAIIAYKIVEKLI